VAEGKDPEKGIVGYSKEMLMKGDLPHIDDLFRKGIEGHEENVPESVWESVNNHLDKKLAAEYKIKYVRLKRAAAFVSLLGLIAVSYHAYKDNTTSGEQRSASIKQHAKKSGMKDSANSFALEDKRRNGELAGKEKNTALTGVGKEKDLKGSGKKLKGGLPASKNSSLLEENGTLAGNKLKDGKKERAIEKHDGPTRKLGNDAGAIAASDPFSISKKHSVGNDKRVVSLTERMPATPFIFLEDKSLASLALGPVPSSQSLVHAPLTGERSANGGLHSANARSGKISLTAFAGPHFNFSRLEDDEHLAGPGRDRREAKRSEQNHTSFTTGLLVNYGIGKRAEIQTGIGFTKSSSTIGSKTVYVRPGNGGQLHYELPCSSGFVYLSPKSGNQPTMGDSATALSTQSGTSYINIPAVLRFHLGTGRLSFYPAFGIGLNLLASSSATTTLSHGSSTENISSNITGLKSGYLNGQFGFGIEYNLSNTISLNLQPNLRIALTPMNGETPVREYQNDASLDLGLRIRF
jgi:hypothetical protein